MSFVQSEWEIVLALMWLTGLSQSTSWLAKYRLEFILSPDVTPSGWLGSKHQLTN